jgi:hypothetical protein
MEKCHQCGKETANPIISRETGAWGNDYTEVTCVDCNCRAVKTNIGGKNE